MSDGITGLVGLALSLARLPTIAMLCSVADRVAPLRLCSYLLFYVFLLSLLTRITSALIVYDKRTLLNIGHRYTNLLQDTLSTNPTWPLEILRNTEENKGHLNKSRRQRIKKHHGKRAGIHNRLCVAMCRKVLTVFLYRVSCSLISNPW